MAPVRIYLDENVPSAVAAGLRRRRIDAFTTAEAGKLGASDEEQLRYAAQEQAVLFTHDADLIRLAWEWAQSGKEH